MPRTAHPSTISAIGSSTVRSVFARPSSAATVSVLKALHDKVAASRPAPDTMSPLIVNVDVATRHFTFLVVDLVRLRELRIDPELSGPDLGLSPPKRRNRGVDRGG